MARFGRSYGKSRLGLPVVVGAAVTFRPLTITLSVNLTTRARPPQRTVRPFLKPPTTVGPPTVFAPIKATLAPSSRLARGTHSRLQPPATVTPPVTFRPLSVDLAQSSRLARKTHSTRTPLPPLPVAAPPDLLIPLRVALAKVSRLPQRIRSRLAPPTVTAPPVTFRPTQTTLAASSRLARSPHSKLRPPAVVAAAVTFGPITLRLVRTPRQPALPHSALKPPTVVGPAAVFNAIRVVLAGRTRLEQVRRAAHSKLNPPSTLAPPAQPPTAEQLKYHTWLVAIGAAARLAARTVHSKLKPPVTTAPAATFDPLKVKLAAPPRQGRHARSFTTPIPQFPAVPPPTLEQLKTHTFLTRRGPVRLVQSKLRPPTVTGPGVVFAPIKTELAPSSRLARGTHPKLKPPAVVSFPVTAEQRYLHLYLARHPRQGRRTIWRLSPPSVIGAFVNLAPPYLEGDPGDMALEGDPTWVSMWGAGMWGSVQWGGSGPTGLDGQDGVLVPAGGYGSVDFEGDGGGLGGIVK